MEQSITFSILKVMVEIIPFNGSTREKRTFVKVMARFKKRTFVQNQKVMLEKKVVLSNYATKSGV